jgi:putative ABC transport system permease protein
MAFTSLRANKLRAGLTVFSIIGVTTAIGILKRSTSDMLSQLGSETFTVKKFPSIQMGPSDWLKYVKRKPITYEQVKIVRSIAKLPMTVSAELLVAPMTASFGNTKSDPEFTMYGSDDEFAINHNYDISLGRMLTRQDVEYARNVTVLGQDVVNVLFKGNINPIGRTVVLNAYPFTVVGVFVAKGGGSGASQDALALIPVTNELKYFTDSRSSITTTVRARSQEEMEATEDEIIGAMRTARGVKPGAENDFEVETNSSLVTQFNDLSKYIFYAGIGISAIALLAASIGIMNIMLVSVTERTKEIGIRKALGATKSDIKNQFLTEAVVLCELGGIIGIFLGVGLGNIIAAFMDSPVFIPYEWVGVGLIVCSLVGIVFGLYPALKAANMAPIDALRFE